jgi:D-glycero-D-manno-heptose 1,7-bisphosphate phosphatase
MKICILDRDGVINHDSDEFIKSPAEWIPIPGSLEAIAKLNHAGYRVFVVTNQSGLGRGYFTIETLNEIHHKMLDALQKSGGKIEAILFCPHSPSDNCDCRKPKNGLLLEIAERIQQPLDHSYLVGDSLRDVLSAWSVNAKPILVKTGKGEKTLKEHKNELGETPIFDNLEQAVDWIIEKTESKTS